MSKPFSDHANESSWSLKRILKAPHFLSKSRHAPEDKPCQLEEEHQDSNRPPLPTSFAMRRSTAQFIDIPTSVTEHDTSPGIASHPSGGSSKSLLQRSPHVRRSGYGSGSLPSTPSGGLPPIDLTVATTAATTIPFASMTASTGSGLSDIHNSSHTVTPKHASSSNNAIPHAEPLDKPFNAAARNASLSPSPSIVIGTWVPPEKPAVPSNNDDKFRRVSGDGQKKSAASVKLSWFDWQSRRDRDHAHQNSNHHNHQDHNHHASTSNSQNNAISPDGMTLHRSPGYRYTPTLDAKAVAEVPQEHHNGQEYNPFTSEEERWFDGLLTRQLWAKQKLEGAAMSGWNGQEQAAPCGIESMRVVPSLRAVPSMRYAIAPTGGYFMQRAPGQHAPGHAGHSVSKRHPPSGLDSLHETWEPVSEEDNDWPPSNAPPTPTPSKVSHASSTQPPPSIASSDPRLTATSQMGSGRRMGRQPPVTLHPQPKWAAAPSGRFTPRSGLKVQLPTSQSMTHSGYNEVDWTRGVPKNTPVKADAPASPGDLTFVPPPVGIPSPDGPGIATVISPPTPVPEPVADPATLSLPTESNEPVVEAAQGLADLSLGPASQHASLQEPLRLELHEHEYTDIPPSPFTRHQPDVQNPITQDAEPAPVLELPPPLSLPPGQQRHPSHMPSHVNNHKHAPSRLSEVSNPLNHIHSERTQSPPVTRPSALMLDSSKHPSLQELHSQHDSLARDSVISAVSSHEPNHKFAHFQLNDGDMLDGRDSGLTQQPSNHAQGGNRLAQLKLPPRPSMSETSSETSSPRRREHSPSPMRSPLASAGNSGVHKARAAAQMLLNPSLRMAPSGRFHPAGRKSARRPNALPSPVGSSRFSNMFSRRATIKRGLAVAKGLALYITQAQEQQGEWTSTGGWMALPRGGEVGVYIPPGLQQILPDDVHKVRELGRGQFGSVWLARWCGVEVALKELHHSVLTDQQQQEVFMEAERLAALRHPCVIAFYGIITTSPDCYGTVLEYVRMGSLRDGLRKLVDKVASCYHVHTNLMEGQTRCYSFSYCVLGLRALQQGDLPMHVKASIALQAARGMEYLHFQGVVHFDLKCDNLLCDLRDFSKPIVKIGDLGLSKLTEGQSAIRGKKMQGTLPWMAPELFPGGGLMSATMQRAPSIMSSQTHPGNAGAAEEERPPWLDTNAPWPEPGALGAESGRDMAFSEDDEFVTNKVDVYSFAVCLWEIWTMGDRPYKEFPPNELMAVIMNGTLRPSIPDGCHPDWVQLMQDCWAARPTDRPTFTEVARRLEAMCVEQIEAEPEMPDVIEAEVDVA